MRSILVCHGAALLTALAVSAGAQAETLWGAPIAVDGDTLRLAVEGGGVETVRLWGVDAPEGGQPGGDHALQALAWALWRRGGHVGLACAVVDRDRWGRRVARCAGFGEPEGALNAEMVRRGWAWDFARYSGGAYAAEERAARAERRGVFAIGDAVPPWEWRKMKREKACNASQAPTC